MINMKVSNPKLPALIAITDKNDFTDGYGFYSDNVFGETHSVYIKYVAYRSNVLVEASLWYNTTSFDAAQISSIVADIGDGFDNPVKPAEPTWKTYTVKDLDPVMKAFIESNIGEFDGNYSVDTTSEDAVKATYNESNDKSSVAYTVKDSEVEAKAYFENDKMQYEKMANKDRDYTYSNVTNAGAFTDGAGCYGFTTLTSLGDGYFVEFEYSAYIGNVYIHASFNISGLTEKKVPTDPVVDALGAGFKS